MNVYLLIYEGFTQFEVVLANYFLSTKGDIVTVGFTDDAVTSVEGFLTKPHMIIKDVDSSDIDLFIIPGGTPDEIEDNLELSSLLKELNSNSVKIGAICSAPLHLANAGVLDGKKYTTTLPINQYVSFDEDNFTEDSVVVDGNIITAKANAYVDFALTLGQEMDIFEDQEDYDETVSFFREFKG